ncbi:hypothetical protein ACWGLE_25095 [Streptomyces sp. NPDC055897]
MLEIGYRIVGATRPSERNVPVFSDEQRLRISDLVHTPERVEAIRAIQGTAEFIAETDAAWSALTWSWYRRFGQPVISRYGQERYELSERVATRQDLNSSRFEQTPEGLCWIWHDLDVAKADGAFMGEWSDTGEPRAILNYRDPRDALVSLINFVEGKTAKGFGNFYERKIFHKILRAKSTMAEKIDYALRDPSFPGRQEFEKSLWLLNHPDVCKVSYEELVGPQGGGSRERQLDAVQRILKHLDATDHDAEEIASRIYSTDSWSFHQGSVGKWRESFSKDNLRLFRDIYGDVLEQYGYE